MMVKESAIQAYFFRRREELRFPALHFCIFWPPKGQSAILALPPEPGLMPSPTGRGSEPLLGLPGPEPVDASLGKIGPLSESMGLREIAERRRWKPAA